MTDDDPATQLPGQPASNQIAPGLLFMLDEDRQPFSTTDPIEWGRWFSLADRRVSESTVQVKDGPMYEVSTVFLGLRVDPEPAPARFFETVYRQFGSSGSAVVASTAETWAEAERRHNIVTYWLRLGSPLPPPPEIEA